jgi:hypothetical protein
MAFAFLMISVLLTGCDTLEEDEVKNGEKISVDKSAIFLQPNSTTIIDLKSRILSSQSVKVSVSQQPKLGVLKSLAEDLLQYQPNTNVTHGTDVFKLRFYDNNNFVLAEDSIQIVITQDTTAYPCGVYAVEDFRYNLQGPTEIDILGNDVICADTASLEISLLDTLTTGEIKNAYFGTVEVLPSKKILYTPGNDFQGWDKFLYKIHKPANAGNPATDSYAWVHIAPTACADSITLGDDFFTFDLDSIQAFDSLLLKTSANDNFCTIAANTFVYSLSNFPQGSVFYTGNYDYYYVFPQNATRGYVDTFKYHVCIDGKCEEAEVTITLR